MDELSAARAAFARRITASEGDPEVRRAFSTVPRELFVGAAPWLVLTERGYEPLPSDDPTALYDDVVVALRPQDRINNGQPSLHAKCLASANVRRGEAVLQVGCGTGYYTAILAELTGASGSVEAWDIEPGLAAAATRNLRNYENVVVRCGDATKGALPPVDVIYVCAGCTRPIKGWVDALRPGGRLLFPLTPGWDFGAMLRVTKREQRLDARFVCRCSFIPCIGASSDDEAAALRRAFERDDLNRVSSLGFGDDEALEGGWFAGNGWSLFA